MEQLDEDYVCSLDAEVLKRAKGEIYEDPKSRLEAVAQLKSWIKLQPHLNCHTGGTCFKAVLYF